MAPRLDLEIAVASASDAVAAQDAGADRVEVSSALELGGLTPSLALIAACVATGAETHVLLRCRPGGFAYDADELAVMAADAAHAIAAGARGVVVGALTPDGALDVAAVARLRDAARGVRADAAVTLHRAVDLAADPVTAVSAAAGLGLDRVLTSGGADRAADGIEVLRRMAALRGAPAIMAGGGVTAGGIAALASAGVAAVHLSAKRELPAANGVALGADGGLRRFAVDPAIVAAARAAIDALSVDPTGVHGARGVPGSPGARGASA